MIGIEGDRNHVESGISASGISRLPRNPHSDKESTRKRIEPRAGKLSPRAHPVRSMISRTFASHTEPFPFADHILRAPTIEVEDGRSNGRM